GLARAGEARERPFELLLRHLLGRVVPADLDVPRVGVVDHRTEAILIDMRDGVVGHLFLLTCAGISRQAWGPGVVWVELLNAGGACARLRVGVLCARAPSLTSVRDPGWCRAGGMMFDGVIPLGEALRPLGLLRPSTTAWRQENAGSRPRRICVTRGLARTGEFMRVPVPP